MLYRTLQKKSIHLESKLIAGSLSDTEVSFFLGLLLEGIPKLYSPENYNNSLELLQKWETIYFDFFGKMHEIRNTYKYNYKEISSDLLSDQLMTHIKVSDFEIKTSQNLSESNLPLFDPINTEKIQFPINLVTNNDYFYKINQQYKKSQLGPALENTNTLISEKLMGGEDGMSNEMSDMIYLSWAIHMAGNIYSVSERYITAYHYYKNSLQIKERILELKDKCVDLPLGFIYYSYFKTKLKYISSLLAKSSSSDLSSAIKELIITKERIVRRKEDIAAYNSRSYDSLLNDYEYNLGKMYFYFGKEEKAIEYLNYNINNSSKINDNPGMLRAELHKMVIEKSCNSNMSLKFDNIKNTLSQLKETEKNSPITKALIGEKHILEYEVLVGEKDFGVQVESLFKDFGVTPHIELAYNNSASPQAQYA